MTGSPAEATAVLTAAGHAGFAPHADTSEVIVLQITGQKFWRVWPADPRPPRGQPRLYSPGELDHPPALATRLESGDVLFIPRGAAHSATTVDSMSVHVSIVIPPRGMTLALRMAVEQVISTLDVVPDLPYRRSGQETAAASLSDALRTLGAALRDGRLDKPLGAALGGATDAAGGFVNAHRAEVTMSPSSQLVAAPGWHLEQSPDSVVRARRGGTSVLIPSPAVQSVTALIDGATIGVAQLSSAPAEDNERLARQLIQLGLATLDQP